MPIPINKAEALEKMINDFFPDTKIYTKGRSALGYKEISFSTDCVVGSFLLEAINKTTSIYIKPTRALQVEVTFY